MRFVIVASTALLISCGGQPVKPGQPAPPRATQDDDEHRGDEQPAPRPQPPVVASDAGPRITHAQTEEECRACNGTWGPRGIIGALGCVCPTIDGGQPCRSPSDCEHRCEITIEDALALGRVECLPSGICADGKRLPQGSCSHTFDIFGCRAWIAEIDTDDGRRLQVRHLCVD